MNKEYKKTYDSLKKIGEIIENYNNELDAQYDFLTKQIQIPQEFRKELTEYLDAFEAIRKSTSPITREEGCRLSFQNKLESMAENAD